MPAQSRAQRRRTNTRQQRPSASTKPRIYDVPADDITLAEQITEDVAIPAVAPTATDTTTTLTPSTSSRVARRMRTRAAPEPVDYTKDYRDTARDLRLIALWSILLFVGMFALYFARANGMF